VAKYLGWRGVQGNFRGKVERVQRRNVAKYQGWRGVQRAISEERWKEWSAAQKQQKRLAAAPTTGPRKKTKKRWKGILKEEVAKLDDDLSS
jgi:hypothetical protein